MGRRGNISQLVINRISNLLICWGSLTTDTNGDGVSSYAHSFSTYNTAGMLTAYTSAGAGWNVLPTTESTPSQIKVKASITGYLLHCEYIVIGN